MKQRYSPNTQKAEKLKNKVYCTAPWNGITVRENGDVRTCCIGKEVLLNLNQGNIHDLENNAKLENIKQQMLHGNAGTNCEGCIKQEEQFGYAQLKEHYNQNYPDIDEDLNLRFLDIRWNNKCNLTCLYCNSNFSSSWEKKQGIIATSAKKNYQDELLDWILERSQQVHEVMLVGGEPLLMKQNKALVDKLDTKCRLSIITNASMPLETNSIFASVQRFPKENVMWNISIDNTEQEFEYVRSGSSWEILKKNILLLTKMYPQQVTVTMVYSVFNALRLSSILKQFDALGVTKFNLQPIHSDENYCLSILQAPQVFRQLALEQVNQIKHWHNSRRGDTSKLYPIQGLDEIHQQLQTVAPKANKQSFLDKVLWLDNNTDSKYTFAQLWKREYELLVNHLD